MANNNLIKIYCNDNNIITIPAYNLPVFEFSLFEDTKQKHYSIRMRLSKNSNIDNEHILKYDYLKDIWAQIKQYSTENINKIEIIQENTVVYEMKNILKLYYHIDFLDERLGEYLEITATHE